MQLTATVAAAGAASAPAGDVEFFAGPTPLGYSPLAATATAADSGLVTAQAHFIAANPGGLSDVYSAVYLGDSNFLPSAPFDLTASQAELTLAGGGSADEDLTLAPVGDFTGTVALTCTVVPAGPACALNPNQLALAGRALTARLSVSTATARAGGSGLWTLAFWCTLLLLPAACRLRPPSRRLAWLVTWGLLACSCGGVVASRRLPLAGTYRVYIRAATPSAGSMQTITLHVR
jgi:hypothetical protein